MGAGLILSIFGGRAYMEYKHRKGRKELKQMILEATENEERKDLSWQGIAKQKQL